MKRLNETSMYKKTADPKSPRDCAAVPGFRAFLFYFCFIACFARFSENSRDFVKICEMFRGELTKRAKPCYTD